MLKLKDSVDFKKLRKYANNWQVRSVIRAEGNSITVPLDLQWYSYWKMTGSTGAVEFLEINMKDRQIRCQGCEDILFHMIKDDLVEEDKPEVSYTVNF